jgi:hypothetical protein
MDGSISKQELITLEQHMLLKLKFKLNPPTLNQYMVLLVSLFNNFTAKWFPSFSQIPKDSELASHIFWLLDGIFLDNDYRNFHNK